MNPPTIQLVLNRFLKESHRGDRHFNVIGRYLMVMFLVSKGSSSTGIIMTSRFVGDNEKINLKLSGFQISDGYPTVLLYLVAVSTILSSKECINLIANVPLPRP